MNVLGRDGFSRVLPLVPSREGAGHMAFVHAVLEGSMAGSVHVDDVGAPRSAVVVNNSGWAFAIGEPRGDLVDAWMPAFLERYLPGQPTGLWATSDGWRRALDPLFARYEWRNEYHPGTPLEPSAPPVLPEGWSLRRIDAGLARQFEGRVDPWVVGIWGGPEAFAERAGGWAVVRDDGVLASFCCACAVGGPPGAVEAEIEIGTAPDSRQRGVAAAAARAFLGECRERGWLPGWTCGAGNVPSARLAERLGFVFHRQVVGYPVSKETRRIGSWWL
ncbi:MAG: GNAT family N-acetyltransferase [Chloroflexi bacterium]|nr:GNAT family N-acetyltransferase [Chloroflexota bacterium]